MGVYDGFVDMAERMIREKGRAVTLIRRSDAADAANLVADTPTTTDDKDYPIWGVVSEYRRTSDGVDPGTLTVAYSRSIMVAAKGLAIVPMVSDMIRMDGGLWSVVSVIPTQPGEQAIMYDVRVTT
jgi:hypothetical protein